MAAPLNHSNNTNALSIVNKLLNQISSTSTNTRSVNDKFATHLTALPNIQILSKGVICILGQNPGKMTLQGTNTYLVGTGKKRFLIDSGQGINSYIPILKQAMKQNQIQSIEGIICTHWHHDHIDGIPSIRKEFGPNIPIYKHRSLSRDDKLNLKFECIADKQIFTLPGATLICHYTPGHSDDHIVIEYKEENSIFSGDCVLGEGSCTFNDLYLYMLSLQKLLTFKCDTMYCGHGPKVNNAQNKINDYINHRNNREQQIIDAFKNNLNKQTITSFNLCDIVYSKTPQNLKKTAHNNLKHHLHKLVMEGRVSKNDKDEYSFIK